MVLYFIVLEMQFLFCTVCLLKYSYTVHVMTVIIKWHVELFLPDVDY